MKVLVVRSAFGDYQRGSRITDPQEVEAVLASPHACHVTPSEHADEQETE